MIAAEFLDRYHIPTPLPNQKVTAFGQSWSGKSSLMRKIIANVPNIVIVDTKKNEEKEWRRIPGLEVTKKDPHKLGAGIWLWQPQDSWLFDRDWKNRTFWDLYRQRGSRPLYIDEFGDMASPPGSNTYPASLQVYAMRGRSAGKGLWGTTQRPHGVPLYLMSEANHIFVFETVLPQDQKRIVAVCERKRTSQPIDFDKLGNYRYFHRGANGVVQGPTWIPKEELI